MKKITENRKTRIPKLSIKPEANTGRYYTSFRTADGKSRRQRFTKDANESQMLYHRWIIEHYDKSVKIISEEQNNFNNNFQLSLPVIANSYVKYEKERVRKDDAKRIRGTISIRVFNDNRCQVVNILRWCKDHFNERLTKKPFDELFTETDYESMMMHFVNRMSNSQVNKHRQRFWEIVHFSRRELYRIRFPFSIQDVRRFGGSEKRKKRQIPTVKMIQQILTASSIRDKLWIWMGLGLGFGNDDLARCRLEHFDKNSYNMSRGKTELPRYGPMRPMVWNTLQCYLKDNYRKLEEPLFISAKGNPLVWVKTKTKEELENGTSTSGPAKVLYRRSDNLSQRWNKLKKQAGLLDWKEGFYIWRHLGATAYASREGISLAHLRTFLGHAKSQVADEYMKPLSPEIKKVVKWINEMLDSNDIDAWKKD
jgi:integrase